MTRSARIGLSCLALAAAFRVFPSAQQLTPAFKTGVDVVRVDFRVLDSHGAFVDGVTADDVQVFESGRQQAISTFDRVSLSTSAEAERTFVLLLDDATGHPLRGATVRAIARKFVADYMQPTDRVALMTTSERKALNVPLTGDKTRLLEAIDRYEGWYGAAGSAGALYVLRDLANALSTPGDRKSIVFISEGLGSNLPDLLRAGPPEYANLLDEVELAKAERASRRTIFEAFQRIDGSSAVDLRDVVAAAARNNVSIYAIDPTGAPGTRAADIKPIPYLAPPESVVAVRPLRRSPGQDAMAVAATETGGAALLGSNNFDGALSRVVDDANSHYVLGYVSSNSKKDGSYRRIEVRTKPGLYVRARTGYVAPKG